jgi:hypothetical protein
VRTTPSRTTRVWAQGSDAGYDLVHRLDGDPDAGTTRRSRDKRRRGGSAFRARRDDRHRAGGEATWKPTPNDDGAESPSDSTASATAPGCARETRGKLPYREEVRDEPDRARSLAADVWIGGTGVGRDWGQVRLAEPLIESDGI